MSGLRGGYNSLRDRHGSSVSAAPISFAKVKTDEYRSRDGWIIRHSYKRGYQAHHEWRVLTPDGKVFDRGTGRRYYSTLSDAVQAINETVALGVIRFVGDLLKWKRAEDEAQAKRDEAAKLRTERETIVWRVLQEHNAAIHLDALDMRSIAGRVVDQLFGKAGQL